MPTYTNVDCKNCVTTFSISLKCFNESLKNGWNFYCCKKCHSVYKKTGKNLMCSNPLCKNKFYRYKSSINKTSNFCSQSCAAIVNNSGVCRNPLGVNKNIDIWLYRKGWKREEYEGLKKFGYTVKYCCRPFCYKIIRSSRKYYSTPC